MSNEAKARLQSLQFVETELQRLQALTSVLQTARIAYVKALKAALPQAAPPFAGDTIKLRPTPWLVMRMR